MKKIFILSTIIFYIISFARKNKILLSFPSLTLIIIFFLFTAYGAFAAEAELEGNYPPIGGVEASGGLIPYIRYVFLYGLATIGLAALIALVIGGLMYMSAGSITKTDEAKKYIWGAIIGLLLGLSSYLILNTINPDLVNLKEPHLEGINMPLGQTYPECKPGAKQTITDKCHKKVDPQDCYGTITYERSCAAGGYWEKPSEEYLKSLECKDLTCYARTLCPDGIKKPQCDASSPPQTQSDEECTTGDGCKGIRKKTRTCGEDGCYPGWLDIPWGECEPTDCGRTKCTGVGAPSFYDEKTCLTNCKKDKYPESDGSDPKCIKPLP